MPKGIKKPTSAQIKAKKPTAETIKIIAKWDEIQIMFLEQHKYFTETSKKTRQEKKNKNVEEVKSRLDRNEYLD